MNDKCCEKAVTIQRDGEVIVIAVVGIGVLRMSEAEAVAVANGLMREVYGEGELQYLRWE